MYQSLSVDNLREDGVKLPALTVVIVEPEC